MTIWPLNSTSSVAPWPLAGVTEKSAADHIITGPQSVLDFRMKHKEKHLNQGPKGTWAVAGCVDVLFYCIK